MVLQLPIDSLVRLHVSSIFEDFDRRSQSIITVPALGIRPTDDEINFAIVRAKSEKSPGVDGIPIEAYKIIGESDILFGEFKRFLHAYWTDPNVDPESFHTSLMTVLPKKGDLSDPNKWRGISLLSVASKLVSSIVATRLGKHFLWTSGWMNNAVEYLEKVASTALTTSSRPSIPYPSMEQTAMSSSLI